MFIIEFSGSRFSNRAIPVNGLTNTLSYSQSKPHALYHQYPADGPAHCWRWRSPEYVYPAIAGSQQNADHRDHARGNFRGSTCCRAPAPSFAEARPAAAVQSVRQRRWKGSAAQSAAGCELPLSRREREFVLSVEDDENHTEGVKRGHKCTDQTCHHQIDMSIRHRTREDPILTEEARSDQRQCRQCCAAHRRKQR